jgi:hypothetical protein
VRISGIENIRRFAEAIPMWGPRGQALMAWLDNGELREHRGSQRNYLAKDQTEPVLAYLHGRGVSPAQAAQLVGDAAGDPRGGLKQVLGVSRLRRDRVERLADALDSSFLRSVLGEEVWYDRIVRVSPPEWRPIYDIEVDEHHTFVANDIVISNCSAPFRQAEFDIMYGKGISREGSLLDMAVDLGIVKKSGAWFTYDGEQLGQGRENAKAFLTDNPEIMVEVSERVLQESGLATPPDAPPADDSSETVPTSPGEYLPSSDDPIELD